MDERSIHIDEFFRRQMDGHIDAPPIAVWNALEKRLDDKPGRKRPFPVWWFWTIAGLILVSSTFIIAGYLKNVRESAIAKNQASAPVAFGQKEMADVPATQHGDTEHTTSNETNFPDKNNSVSGSDDRMPAKEDKFVLTTSSTNSLSKPTNTPAVNSGLGTDNHPQETSSSAPGTAVRASQSVIRHTDKLSLLSVTTVGVHMPVSIPLAPKRYVRVPVVALPVGDNVAGQGSGIAQKNESEVVSAPLPTVASLSPGQATSGSLPGLLQSHDEVSSDVPLSELQATLLNTSLSQDTSKKKKTALDASTDSLLNETVYAVNTTKKKPLRVDAGIKLGFSRGFDRTWNADKWIIAPFVQYRMPANLSLIIQPSFQFGRARVGAFANSNQVFYELRSSDFDSMGRVSRGAIDSSVVTPNPPDTVFRTYRYGQVYDSIHVGYKVTNTQMWDVELPLMLQYRVSKTFAFIVGGSVAYSSVLQTKEEVTRYEGLTRSYQEVHAPQTFFVTTQGQEPPPGPPRKSFSDLFQYDTAPFSDYSPRQVAATNNFFRYGFMVGASASFKERWMVELMLHKTGVDANAVPEKQLQKIYTQPYLRLMVGYKITR